MFKKLILAVLTTIFILTGCANQPTSNPKETIKIGIILPLSGIVSSYGQELKKGLELALIEINSPSSTYKHQLELVYEDSILDPKLSVAAAQKFIEMDNIKIIIGDYRSPNTLAIAPITEKNKVILISPAASSDQITTAGNYVFRTQVSTSKEAKELAKFVSQNLSITQVSTLVSDQSFGHDFEDIFKVTFEKLGGQVIGTYQSHTSNIDHRNILTKIQKDSVTHVVLAIGAKEAAYAIRQARELDMPTIFIANSLVQNKDLFEVGGDSVENLIYTYPYDSDLGISEVTNFSQRYQAQYGTENEMLSANSYDALMLIAKVTDVCNQNTDCIQNELYYTQNYSGASGILSFDQNGDIDKPLVIKTVKDGQFVKYEK